jgi:hypothetical protein
MNPETVADLCGELTLLNFFPSEPTARRALFLMVGRMCANEDQVKWLVRRTIDLCNEWPGPLVLRQILCSKFKAADGIEVSCTDRFVDGVPSEKPEDPLAQLEQWKKEHPREIAAPEVSIEQEIKALARRPWPKVVPMHTNPNYKKITQADIDQALKEHREKKMQEAAKAAQSELLPPKPDVA